MLKDSQDYVIKKKGPGSQLKKISAFLLVAIVLGSFLYYLFLLFGPREIGGKPMPLSGFISRPKSEPVGQKTPKQVRVKPEAAPELMLGDSKLPLRLAGISWQGEESVAYIENLTKFSTGSYKVGDIILGARLVEILSGQVTLLSGSKKIVLTLENSYDWAEDENWVDSLSQESFVVSKSRLIEKAKDTNYLLTEVIPIPHISGGQIDGFTLSTLREGGVINEAGFEQGDIIKSVNGRKLDSIKKPIEVYDYLRELVANEKEPLIEVNVERNGVDQTLTYRILPK